ncbi:hypothetical protein pEaSNUABM11_00264 [Erwinia phage pEa_SNUABM_11]|nr:hypothetical protein pEaSNUABM11_00264 [Erwinia phage pEa_SNUABM_11]
MGKELKVAQPIDVGDVTVSPFASVGIGDAPVGKTGLQLDYDGGAIDPYAEVSEVAKLKDGAINLSTHVEVGAHVHVSDTVEISAAVTQDDPQHGDTVRGVSVGVKWTF